MKERQSGGVAPRQDTLLLDVRQVAEYLSISVRGVWRAVSAGEVPEPTKIGRRTLWHRPTLEAFFDDKLGRGGS